MAFVLASAWQFSRRPEPGRIMRAINLTLVPLGVLVALVGVLAASFNAFAQQEGTPSTNWAIVMVALGLGGASLLLAVEGFVLRSRVHSSTEDRRAIGLRSLSLIATTVPHGGHELARGPEEIRLDQVIDCLEGNGAKSRQPDGAQPGDSRLLAHVTEKAEEAARDVFASHTLADCLRLRRLEPRVFHGIFHAGVAKPRGS